MLDDVLAGFFRRMNATLLYINFWPAEKFLKTIFFISNRVYKNWMKIARTPRRVQIRIDRDISMKVDPSKAMGAAFYWMGFHEFNGWRFLHHHLKPTMTFVDIGANQGEYSLFAAKRLTNGLVLAFEPVDHFFQQLSENISLNHFNNIRTFPFGLSNVTSQVPIYMGAQGAGEHEGLATIYQSSLRKRFIQNIDLKVLDNLEPGLGLVRIDFIKIDVEGAELMVLKGSLKTIIKYKPWVMLEISEDTYRSAGYSVSDVREFFNSIGYSLYTIGRAGQLTKANEIPSYCNVIFKPN